MNLIAFSNLFINYIPDKLYHIGCEYSMIFWSNIQGMCCFTTIKKGNAIVSNNNAVLKLKSICIRTQ